jgi:hypothetical protein
VRRDLQATQLRIPALGIDSVVQKARTIPYVDVPIPGCPSHPEDTETLEVPHSGITTPADNLDGLENKAWIFGHSRWLGASQTFFKLEDLNLGDELSIDAIDRVNGETLKDQRYRVSDIYLTDTHSGSDLITATSESDIPSEPIVILQTSVREDGPGKQWILSQSKLMSKAKVVVAGELSDPCKYLLLFVFARPA